MAYDNSRSCWAVWGPPIGVYFRTIAPTKHGAIKNFTYLFRKGRRGAWSYAKRYKGFKLVEVEVFYPILKTCPALKRYPKSKKKRRA